MSIMRAIGLTGALTFSLVLVACTGGPIDAGATPSSVTATQSDDSAIPGIASLDAEYALALSTQARETGLTPPAQVFRGDCANLYSAAEISDIVGVAVTPVPTGAISDDDDSALALHGGIRCLWQASDQAVTVYLVALPEKAVNYQAHDDCDVQWGSAASGCVLAFAGGWIHLSGILATTRANLSDLPDQRIALFDLFLKRISAENLAVPPEPAAGAWTFPVDCASIVAAAKLSAVPGLGAGSTGRLSGGSDIYYPQAEIALWEGSTPGECEITGDSVEVNFSAEGGARYNEEAIAGAAGVQPLSVAGLDSVYVTLADDGRQRIDVFDGPNWLRFEVTFVKNAGPLATALVASLDATALP